MTKQIVSGTAVEQIPDGYKQDHGYIIPKEWKVVHFDKCFHRLTQKNAENNQNVLTISAQQGLISQLDYYNTLYASEDKTGYFLLQKGDFAYNKSYSADYPYGAIKQLEKYEKGIVSPLYICFSANDGINTDFYRQYFEAGMFNREIYKIAQEGARNHGLLNVSTPEFFSAALVYPPVEEQKKIAQILKQCDRVIALKQERLTEEQRRRRWLSEALLNTGTKIELRQCCIASGEYGLNAPACPFNPNLPRYIRITDIDDNGKYQGNTPVSVNAQDAEQYRLQEGDILFVRTGGTVGKAYRYLPQDGKLVYAGFLIKFSVNQELFDPRFIYYQFSTSRYKNWVSIMSVRSGQPGINANEYGKYLLNIPESIAEQKRIADILEEEDRLIDCLFQEIKQWKAKKVALSQLLLTGIVRVKV